MMSDPPLPARGAELARLHTFLAAAEPGLTLCSVSGPGGVGKSYLLAEALRTAGLKESGAVVLRVDASNEQARGDFFGVLSQLCPRSLPAPARSGHDYFPTLRKVERAHRRMLEQARSELDTDPHTPAQVKEATLALLRAGRRLNKIVPKTREYLDLDAVAPSDRAAGLLFDAAWELAGGLRSMRDTGSLPGPVRDLLGWSLTTRVREELYEVTAGAILTDLHAAITGYVFKDALKLLQRRIEGARRLVIVIDDFEALAPVLQEFLVGALVPALAEAGFGTALVVLSRDALDAMHPAWGQHCREYIRDTIPLPPLDREAAYALLRSAGVAEERLDRLYTITQGYPFLLSLVAEESQQEGGNSALFLRKFYDRTTRWMNTREREWFERVCYLDRVDHDTLARLFPPGEVQRVQDWFEHEASIRDPDAPTFVVRPLIREKCQRYIETRSPTRHADLARRAAG